MIHSPDRIRPGRLAVVVGPSGAGKDSLINFARPHLQTLGIGFVRRVITRPTDGQSEDHEGVDAARFAALQSEGAFALTWQAHGLSYGIPAATLAEIQAGRTMVVNGSRKALAEFCRIFPNVVVIHVTARPEIIAARLAARGREDIDAIRARLARQTGDWQGDARTVTIDNSGSLAASGAEMLSILTALASRNVLTEG